MKKNTVLRIASPSNMLIKIIEMYKKGFGIIELSSFNNHNRFDLVIIGQPKFPYHLEFTTSPNEIFENNSNKDNLLVLYINNKFDGKDNVAKCLWLS